MYVKSNLKKENKIKDFVNSLNNEEVKDYLHILKSEEEEENKEDISYI